MKFLIVLSIVFVAAKASIIGLSPLVATTSVIKGASATGAAVGADGAIVTAVDGATIVGVAPIRTAVASAVIAPRVIAAAPAVVAAAPVLTAAPAVVAAAPASSAVIAGPSGAIAASSGGSVAVAPVVRKTIIAAPAIASASAVVAPAYGGYGGYGGYGLIKGHGLIL